MTETKGNKRVATSELELADEYRFDYTEARPNRFGVSEYGLGTEISALFSKVGLKADIPELRGYKVKPIALQVLKARKRRSPSS